MSMLSYCKKLGRVISASFMIAIAGQAAAMSPIQFNGDWDSFTFSRRPANQFSLKGDLLELRSAGAVSMIWRHLGPNFWDTRRAKWGWEVTVGTPKTDLSKMGGDDRNIALYFAFVPKERAEKFRKLSMARMLRAKDVRVLIYVWGGSHQRNAIVPNPYFGDRGKTVVLRSARTGDFFETVDFQNDFRRAFGEDAGALVGLAVSGDSDDTQSKIVAQIEDLVLE